MKSVRAAQTQINIVVWARQHTGMGQSHSFQFRAGSVRVVWKYYDGCESLGENLNNLGGCTGCDLAKHDTRGRGAVSDTIVEAHRDRG